ncbi:MAG TPA: serine hydrolase [Brevundimonas sp.]|jgi:CubicO group peptidase (beta-lactamase class C family)
MIFDGCALHDVRSISKSVVSLLWGIADGEGKTPPLDTKVVSLYPELAMLARDGREDITIRHLLTMSTGLDWDEENYGALSNPETGLYWRTSQVRQTFARRVVASAGSRFNYCGGNAAILADLLARYTGHPLPQYAEEHLLKPLGIQNWSWVNDYRGRPLAFSGLRLAPRDLLKIGQLLLSGGQFDGRTVVPAAWIQASTTRHIATGDGLHYGYQWWLGDVASSGGRHPYIAGFGNGGQRLYAVPVLDLVVAITAGNYGKPEQRLSNDLFRRIAATAIPAGSTLHLS